MFFSSEGSANRSLQASRSQPQDMTYTTQRISQEVADATKQMTRVFPVGAMQTFWVATLPTEIIHLVQFYRGLMGPSP